MNTVAGSSRAKANEGNFAPLFDNFEVDKNPGERALRAVFGWKDYLLRMEIDPQQVRVNGPC